MGGAWVPVLQSLTGLMLIPLLAWGLCENRAALPVRRILATVAAGLALQFLIATLLLKVPQARAIFDALTGVVGALQRASAAGTQLVFGYLGGGRAPFDMPRPEAGFILAFQALPLILLMSVISRLLYHWGILQRVVAALASLLRRAFGVGGPLGTATAANVMLGMVEAPLLIRPYLATMSRSALFGTMVAGMATIAGTVLVLYAAILEPLVAGAAGHLLAASLMNAPAAILLARLAVPDASPADASRDEPTAITLADAPSSSMDAIVQGTADGLRLLAAVVAMLVVMVALVALANEILGLLPVVGGAPLSLERIVGWLAMPLALAVGIPWAEAPIAGALIGKKIILNEFVAYLDMARLTPEALTPRSRVILTYALCGFANLGSLGIMLGGLVAMAPGRRAELIELGPRALVVGALATLLSAAVVGCLLWPG